MVKTVPQTKRERERLRLNSISVKSVKRRLWLMKVKKARNELFARAGRR